MLVHAARTMLLKVAFAAIAAGCAVNLAIAQKVGSLAEFQSLTQSVKDELDLDLVFPFLAAKTDVRHQMMRPGGVIVGDIRKMVSAAGAQWDLRNATYCPPPDDGRVDVQPGSDLAKPIPISNPELQSIFHLSKYQLTRLESAVGVVTNVSFLSVGSDVIAGRSRAALATCSAKRIRQEQQYVIRRVAYGTIAFSFASKGEPQDLMATISLAAPLLGIDPIIATQGKTVVATSKSDALVGILLRRSH